MKNLYKLFKGNDFLPVCYLLCMFLFSSVLVVSVFLPHREESARTSAVPETVLPASVPMAPTNAVKISAQGACVVDVKSSKVIFGKNQDLRLPMASTTKIMTALVAIEKLPFDKIIQVDKKAAGVEGSSIYLFEGEKITVESLLYGLMLESGNDAATALAIATAGSEDNFVKLMNEKAKELHLNGTHFTNPHGLPDEYHYTTAYELAALSAYAMKNEKFRNLVSSKKYVTASTEGGVVRFFSNHNKLLRLYNGAIGVKTGFTKAAGRCLVSAAERENETYVVVTLNAPNDWNDHMNLLEYAFANYDSVKGAGRGVFTFTHKGITYSNSNEIYLTSPAGQRPLFSYRAEIHPPKGGKVLCYADGILMGEVPLLPEKRSTVVDEIQ